MTRLLSICCALFLLVSCTKATHPGSLSYPSLTFSLPDVEKITLPNGIRLYLKEDHELPLVEFSAMFGGGSILDPADKVGLADLLARTLRTGGAGEHSASAIDSELERIAADFSVTADTYALNFAMSLHKRDLVAGLAILTDTMRRPLFDPERLEHARRQKLEEVRRQNDRPQALASRLLTESIYGNHPLGRTATAASIAAITRDDLLTTATSTLGPDNLWIAISGDFSRDELLAQIEGLFGDWRVVSSAPSQPAPPVVDTHRNTILVNKDLPQTVVMLGELGVSKDAQDLPALRVMNFILGGGSFNSRLMREIRNDRGLAYSVFSYFQVGRRFPGSFVVQCETKNSSAVESVRIIRSEIEKIRDTVVSDDELRVAKESLINSFVFSFTSSHDVVAQALRLDFYGYPADYLTNYRDRIAAVTQQDVLRSARARLHPEFQKLVLVGKMDEIQATADILEGSDYRDVKESQR